MIKIGQEYEIAVWLRGEIMDMIAGVEDASSISWNDKSQNRMTERSIVRLSAGLADRLRSCGVIRVFEHGPCGCDEHEKLARFSVISETSYWRLVLDDGRTDAHTVKDGRLFIEGKAMGHSDPDMTGGIEPCLCQPAKPVDHTIARYYAWPFSEYTRLGLFYECQSILGAAKTCSRPNKPRSAVREQLLKCVILLNEAIAPVCAAEHIATRSAQ